MEVDTIDLISYSDEEVFECLKKAEREAGVTEKRYSSEEVLYALRSAIEESREAQSDGPAE